MLALYGYTIITKELIDYLIAFKGLGRVLYLGGLLVLIDIAMYALNTLAEYLNAYISTKAMSVLSLNMVENLYYARYVAARGDILARFVSDLPTLAQTLSGFAAGLFFQVSRIAVSVAIMLILSPKLTLLVLTILPFYYLLYRYTSKKVSESSIKEREALSQSVTEVKKSVDYSEFVRRTLTKNYFLARTKRSVTDWLKNYLRLAFYRIFFVQTFHNTYSILSTAVLFIAGAYLVSIGETTVGTIIAFRQPLYNAYEPFSLLAESLATAASVVPYIHRYYEVIRTEKEDIAVGEELRDFEEITYDDVCVSLRGLQILKNISTNIKKGETVAIVGPSAAGKTTMALTLLRIYEPTSGTIRFDGKDYRNFSIKSIRANIYYVPVEDVILKTSLADNICLGTDIDEAELSEILEITHVDFVLDPHTLIDPEKLSLGQRQRIALARALARKPKVLILDEALSGLDAPLEEKIVTGIRKYLKESTIILITHRITTLKHANKILVLSNGELLDSGTHQELYRRCSLYKEIVEKSIKTLQTPQ